MSWLSDAYKKSGLRDIYERNKKEVLGGLTFGVSPALASLAALPLVAKNQADKKKEGVLNALQEQQNNKNKANNDLTDLLNGITGNPNAPVPGGNLETMPTYGPTTPTPTDPTVGSITNPVVPVTGGITQTGGQASTDQNRLLAEAELQKKAQQDFAAQQQATRAQLLQQYADLISGQQNRILDENAPGLYEDLNTRGLLRSSELGNALGRERAKAAAILQENIGLQGLQDRSANLADLAGIENQYNQGRYGAIQRGFSLEDFARQTEAARLTGQALAPIQQATPSAKGASSLQGAIGGGTIGANFGAPGAGIGAGVGLLSGGLLGSK